MFDTPETMMITCSAETAALQDCILSLNGEISAALFASKQESADAIQKAIQRIDEKEASLREHLRAFDAALVGFKEHLSAGD